MAITYPDASVILASDLIVEIIPRWISRFRGTKEQLIAEGLIPPGFEWPHRTQSKAWSTATHQYSVQRCRLPGAKGPMSIWVDGDFWVLEYDLVNNPYSYQDHDIYEKTRELAEIIRRGTHEWSRIANASWEARCDDKYMAFRNLLTGEPKRGRGRPSKATAQSNAAPE